MAEGAQISFNGFLNVGTLNCLTLKHKWRKEQLVDLAENLELDLVSIQGHQVWSKDRDFVKDIPITSNTGSPWRLIYVPATDISQGVGVLVSPRIKDLISDKDIFFYGDLERSEDDWYHYDNNGYDYKNDRPRYSSQQKSPYMYRRLLRVDLRLENRTASFFCVYAPTATAKKGKWKTDGDSFYKELLRCVQKSLSDRNLTVVLGDFNASLEHIRCGPYELKLTDNTKNLKNFMQNLQMVSVHAKNTVDQPQNLSLDAVEQLITFVGSKNPKKGEEFHPFGTTRFAQLDHILIQQSERQTVTYSCTVWESLFPSDHKLLCCQIRLEDPLTTSTEPKSSAASTASSSDPSTPSTESNSSAASTASSSDPSTPSTEPNSSAAQGEPQRSRQQAELINRLTALREYRYEFTKKAWYDIKLTEIEQEIQELQLYQQLQLLLIPPQQQQQQQQQHQLSPSNDRSCLECGNTVRNCKFPLRCCVCLRLCEKKCSGLSKRKQSKHHPNWVCRYCEKDPGRQIAVLQRYEIKKRELNEIQELRRQQQILLQEQQNQQQQQPQQQQPQQRKFLSHTNPWPQLQFLLDNPEVFEQLEIVDITNYNARITLEYFQQQIAPSIDILDIQHQYRSQFS